MNLQCPSCHQPLTSAELNIKEGVGLCPACGKLTRLSELAGTTSIASLLGTLMEQGISAADTDIASQWRDLPKGCQVRGWPGHVTLQASTRSLSAGIFMLFFALFWNGIVSVFVSLVIASWLHHLFGWSAKGMNDLPWPMTLFMTLFLTPFVLVGLFTLFTALMSFVGSVRLSVQGNVGRVSTGIGPLRHSKAFDASQVVNVTMTQTGKTRTPNSSTPNMAILIEAEKQVKFGSLLPRDRQKWLASAAAVVLMNPGSPDETTLLASGDAHALGL